MIKISNTIDRKSSSPTAKRSWHLEMFSGAIPTSSTYDEKGYSQELAFVDRLKAKLNTSDHQEFLRCLNLFSKEIISQPELQSLVSDLIGRYPDLMEAFRVILVQCEKNEGLLSGLVTKKSLWSGGKCPQPTKSPDKDTDREHERIERFRERDREKERLEKAAASQKWAKSISELDVSNCEQRTPTTDHLIIAVSTTPSQKCVSCFTCNTDSFETEARRVGKVSY